MTMEEPALEPGRSMSCPAKTRRCQVRFVSPASVVRRHHRRSSGADLTSRTPSPIGGRRDLGERRKRRDSVGMLLDKGDMVGVVRRQQRGARRPVGAAVAGGGVAGEEEKR